MSEKEAMSKEEWNKFVHSNPKIKKYLLASGETDSECRNYFNRKAQGESGLVIDYNDLGVTLIAGFLCFNGLSLLGLSIFGDLDKGLGIPLGLICLGFSPIFFSINNPKIKTPVSDAKKTLLKQAEYFDKKGTYRPY